MFDFALLWFTQIILQLKATPMKQNHALHSNLRLKL